MESMLTGLGGRGGVSNAGCSSEQLRYCVRIISRGYRPRCFEGVSCKLIRVVSFAYHSFSAVGEI
jgi:hypothetical protein